jgi:transmembrane sensor
MEELRLRYLVAQWQQSALNEDEQRELTTFLANPESRGQFVALMTEVAGAEEGNYAFDANTWMPVINNALQSDKHMQPVLVPARRPFRWMAAAAVAALLVSGSLIYITKEKDYKPPVADSNVTSAADVAPGQDVAILTLSDGSTVRLDSAGRQTIQQGKTMVNQQNGSLEYVAADNAVQVTYNTLTVPRGGQFQVVLPDGTKVWLNAASSLVYPTAFTEKERVVEIIGQGYFEVARNTSQPFVVKVNGMEVQVLGTSFDVMAYPEEQSINTTLIDGSVKVKYGGQAQQLRPGQQAILDNGTLNFTMQQADTDQVIAWKSGFFEFDNENLSTIMRQVARWYDIEVNLNNTKTARRFGGRISRKLPLSDVLNMLSEGGVSFQLKGRTLDVSTVK